MDQLSGSSGSFALLETLPAINRAALRRLERDCRLTLTAGADSLGFYALVIASALWQTKRLGALALTSLTAFRFVLELFVVEEKLFTGSEDEVSAAVHTLKNLVLELHREMPPFLLHLKISAQENNYPLDLESDHLPRVRPLTTFCVVSYYIKTVTAQQLYVFQNSHIQNNRAVGSNGPAWLSTTNLALCAPFCDCVSAPRLLSPGASRLVSNNRNVA
jgi:hypothetical protein